MRARSIFYVIAAVFFLSNSAMAESFYPEMYCVEEASNDVRLIFTVNETSLVFGQDIAGIWYETDVLDPDSNHEVKPRCVKPIDDGFRAEFLVPDAYRPEAGQETAYVMYGPVLPYTFKVHAEWTYIPIGLCREESICEASSR